MNKILHALRRLHRAAPILRRAPGALALCACACWPAHAITGTWAGELVGTDGERLPITYQFSARGALIVQLPAQHGHRAIELTHVGQSDSWLAPNGRPASGRVLALDAGQAHFDTAVTMTSGGQILSGVLRHERVDMQLRFRQSGEWLLVSVSSRSEVTVSGGPYVPRPEVSMSVYRGQLQRIGP